VTKQNLGGMVPTHCERDASQSDLPAIPLDAMVAGVGAMAAYADENGCIPNAQVYQAFEDGLSAALSILKITTSGESQPI
jgi:hypothetical protein